MILNLLLALHKGMPGGVGVWGCGEGGICLLLPAPVLPPSPQLSDSALDPSGLQEVGVGGGQVRFYLTGTIGGWLHAVQASRCLKLIFPWALFLSLSF